MPSILVVLVIIAPCIGLLIYIVKNKTLRIKEKKTDFIIFISSLISLLISTVLFWNKGVYVDNYGSSSMLVSGGEFWLITDWLRLGLIFIVSLITFLRFIKE